MSIVLPVQRPAAPGLYDVGGRGGTFRYQRLGPIVTTGFSGGALESLRQSGCFGGVLWVFTDYPHRVTRLDAAYDVRGVVSGPIIRELYDRYKIRGVPIGTRPLPVRLHSAIDADGVETGTMYAETKNSRVKVCVYDKRKEQLDNRGLLVDHWLRYELRVRGGPDGVPVSLRDVQDPTALFWHFMSPAVVNPPGDVEVPRWESAKPVGFVLGPRVPVEPSDRLKRYVEHGGADELARLASACGPGGQALLNSLMRERLEAVQRAALPASAARQDGQ